MEELNGRVTTRILYETINATKETLRAEHNVTRDALKRIEEKIESICSKLDARPAARWFGHRATGLIDRLVPLGVVALITWILTRGL